jgi:hypothetical protein
MISETEINVQEDQIFFLLNTLNKDFDNKEVSRSVYNKEFNINNASTLTEYVVNTFEEEGKVTKILKSINQNLVGRVAIDMKEIFNKYKLRFRDHQGGWRIEINYQMKDNKINKLIVNHIREEIVYTMEPKEDYFIFKWRIEIEYGVDDYGIENVEVYLEEIIFEDKKKALEYKKKAEKVKKIFDCNKSNEKIFVYEKNRWFVSSCD